MYQDCVIAGMVFMICFTVCVRAYGCLNLFCYHVSYNVGLLIGMSSPCRGNLQYRDVEVIFEEVGKRNFMNENNQEESCYL